MQMLEQAGRDLVAAGRAARAALVPVRPEHEVAHDELAAAAKQVQQAGLAVGPVEDVILLDPHHRQLAPPDAQRVTRPGHRLLAGEQLKAGCTPLGRRYDLGKTHLALLKDRLISASLSSDRLADQTSSAQRAISPGVARQRGPAAGPAWLSTAAGSGLRPGRQPEGREDLGIEEIVNRRDPAAGNLDHLQGERLICRTAGRPGAAA